ncbi:MAG: hypothetical protein WC620_03315 [Methanoregula sp.]|jgi:plastocyanin
MKKLLVVLSILFIGILLAGCTSQPAAPVATPVPTAVPTVIVTVPPTAEPTKEVIVVVNKTANVIATPTPALVYTITFTQDMTIIPDTTATIKVGTVVNWVNMDSLKPHGVQALNDQSGKYFGGMGTVVIPYGAEKSLKVTFDKVGAYDYTTTFQPHTLGKIIVTA